MEYKIRELRREEADILETFLYEAIFVPEGETPPEKDIIKNPELQIYISDFGTKKDDICFVTEVKSQIVGAVWVRIMNDYGHVDDETPSFAISMLKDYRHCGIGTKLMEKMLSELKTRGYRQASLSVQKMNYAAEMYKKIGFEVVDENDEEYIMIYRI